MLVVEGRTLLLRSEIWIPRGWVDQQVPAVRLWLHCVLERVHEIIPGGAAAQNNSHSPLCHNLIIPVPSRALIGRNVLVLLPASRKFILWHCQQSWSRPICDAKPTWGAVYLQAIKNGTLLLDSVSWCWRASHRWWHFIYGLFTAHHALDDGDDYGIDLQMNNA